MSFSENHDATGISWLSPAIHATVLSCVNLASVVIGFILGRSWELACQKGLHILIAALLSILGFLVWTILAHRLRWLPTIGVTWRPTALIYMLSLTILPLLFVVLHYVTQGYLTSLANVVALWLFQVPTNAMAIAGSVLLCGRLTAKVETLRRD